MSQAEALLNDLTETTTNHKHVVPDSDTHFIVDPYTRQIENTNYNKTVLMQGDHNSERFTFEIPRYVDGHDMSLCNRVIVHFDNIGESDYDVNSDVAYMMDLHINLDKPDTVISSWLIRREATQIAGILSFSLQYQCIENDEVTYEWNTDSYEGIEIRKSKNNGESAVIQYSNVLEEWREQLFGAGKSVVEEIKGEGTYQLNTIMAAGANERSDIELKGTDTLATIPDDYTEIYNMASEAIRTKADCIVCEAEGDVVRIENSSNDHIRGLKVYGKTTQVVTTGAQVIPQPYYDTDKTVHGVTFTVNPDGSITISGTNTATELASCYFTLHSSLNLSGTYTYKCYGLPDSCVTNIYYIGDITGEGERTMNLVDGNSYGIIVRVKPNATVNATVYPMLVAGDTIKPYEPYTAGTIAPNHEYPQDLVCVENPTIKAYGKNLLNADKLVGGTFVKENGVYTFTKLANSATSATYTLNLPAGDYVLSWGEIERTAESYRIYINYADGSNQLTGLTNLGTNKFKISTKVGIKDIRLSLASNVTTDTYVKFAWWQLESGTEATSYEPYKSAQTITLANTLRGIPVTSGGNYTDENGQQWVCDEVDLERGVYIQRFREVAFTGQENWVQDTNYICAYRVGAGHIAIGGLCTHYPTYFITEDIGTVSGVYLAYTVNHIITDTRFVNDLNGFKAFLAGEYASGNPVTVLRQLTEPIETPLTAEEVLAFRSLKTNYPNTMVMNNHGAWMKVKYNADTKLYIAEMADNRASSLVEEILNDTY